MTSNWSKTSAAARGYGAAWQRLRAEQLRLHPLCQCERCGEGKIRITVAREVDHRIPKASGGGDDPANLRSVSRECHRRISLEQRGYRPLRRWARVGRDGIPDGWLRKDG